MCMVHIGDVWMPTPQALVAMHVHVRLARRIVGTMHMLMVCIVNMQVPMLDRLVLVVMLVVFGQMQPNAEAHQNASDDQLNRNWLGHWRLPRRGTVPSRVGPGSRRAKMPECKHEKGQADAIAEKPDDTGDQQRGHAGRLPPTHNPKPRLTGPAISPFNSTIWQRISQRDFAS